ncbi:DUF2834 domain-containing protein [Deinococcus marmoris]|uniref:DUF2834 domain-containing protein n=1 Tax=Deinococcus marmoris TaxID=249408 RepID=UPI000498180F|nr:DUF2834 domain-containing protein [Deinococcus marmoris]
MTARKPRLLPTVYFVLSLLGLLGTWYFNLQFEFEGGSYLAAWFANPASSSAAIDLITLLVVASVLYLREGSRLGWRWYLSALFIPLYLISAPSPSA